MMYQRRRNTDFIDSITSHRSVRKFTDEKIPSEDLEKILSATRTSSSSSHGQAYSIVNVSSPEKRELLVDLVGNQPHVAISSHFFVFCADLHRINALGKREGIDMKTSMETTEMFIVATVDAALAAQNTAIAAEALGYGIVYTGGIRNNIEKVSNLLHLPELTYPVFGMCIGVPIEEEVADVKPRLPFEAIYFDDEYPTFEKVENYLNEYDLEMKEHYENRLTGKRLNKTWSQVMIDKRKEPRRLDIKDYLKKQGFPLL
ncbi:oxygen-insensitive NADPH nitroreductase [Oceanobacillus saliphilus]|uniref:oxygen-insensitive NADPH nitroreductase n=1 Tax=Oceanobacillus saliphilus TaxID=2925834 RepID=UPI00201E46CC|nr:oxygen-insensitive NADPH nitroreductase [Oceanobacillus saliphilus]